MTFLKELLPILHADTIYIILSSHMVGSYPKEGYEEVLEKYGEYEVMRCDFHTSYGVKPEIYIRKPNVKGVL